MLRTLSPRDYRRMPWRNGGGTTTELVIAPESAALTGERFLYRVSIADVAQDGPFSRFEGYDRHIMLLEGAGMTLDCGPHGRIALDTTLQPRAFSGDWDVLGALIAGPVRDFNLMVDRARASSSLEVRRLAAGDAITCTPGDTCVIHIFDGDTIVTDASYICPVPAHVALARITPRATCTSA